MIVAQELNITHILTGDRHFIQAGSVFAFSHRMFNLTDGIHGQKAQPSYLWQSSSRTEFERPGAGNSEDLARKNNQLN